MKELEQYIGTPYSDTCQTSIITETAANFPDPEMTTTTNLGIERQKTFEEMTYIENIYIDKVIRQKLRKKDVYESDMRKIYNLIVGRSNEQLQKKVK